MFKVSVIGFGGRGGIYTHNFAQKGIEIAAVCDLCADRLALAKQYTNNLYQSEEEFFAQGKLSDLLVIATMDKDHIHQVRRALKMGYDLLLEKPVATTAEECEEIAALAKRYGRKVIVCHVLRYAPFFVNIKKLIDSGKLGEVVNVQLCESIAYYHFAHSYVRGNWRNEEVSSPVILAKSCHDLDIINWFVGAECTAISSFGDLYEFKRENAPTGHTERCQDCPHKDTCKYSCFQLYFNEKYERIAALVRHGRLGNTREEIIASLSDGKNLLGRCVWECDNDVCDNQVVNMQFSNGVNAQFMLSAFNEEMGRNVRIFCTNGEIYGNSDKDEVRYRIFGDDTEHVISFSKEKEVYGSHGGGDAGIVNDVIAQYESGNTSTAVSDISVSVASHIMCFAAEQSRKAGGALIKL